MQFQVGGTPDVSPGELLVEIARSQVFAQFSTSGSVANIFTLRNLVEDAVRVLLDIAGYLNGYGYDADIIQYIAPKGAKPPRYVFGIDIPVLATSCTQAGVSANAVLAALQKQDGAYVRQALADVREAIKNPKDTGFFCYRAIESLKNGYAHRRVIDADVAWEPFRKHYTLSKNTIMLIKSFADPVRHGDYAKIRPMSDSDRATIFQETWNIINQYIVGETDSVPVG